MSANAPTSPFPAPVGGVLLPEDFAPSLLFGILYLLLIPFIALRFISKSSRTMVIMGVALTTIVRVLNFAFRMAQSKDPSLRASITITIWLQGSYSATFIALANDVIHIGRAYLVGTTRAREPEDPADDSALEIPVPAASDGQQVLGDSIHLEDRGFPDVASKSSSKQKIDIKEVEVEVTIGDMSSLRDEPNLRDEPKRRRYIRILCIIFTTLLIICSIMWAVSGGIYYGSMLNLASDAMITQVTSMIETVIPLLVLQSMNVLLLFAWITRPRRVCRNRILYLCLICCILTIPIVYRLTISSVMTTSWEPDAPDSLNSHTQKALFYSLHIVPELLAAVLLLRINIRIVYNTGLGGDWGMRDKK
ncbi:uncharacterized protein C8Q71DRAFT_765800 [Rhodofomes roseus]|uniref:Uncharacterized protein n=1 Tax=Rhodofomes roseus TaxID=34475 RepID=A0ABQ8KCX9_9APHY|nr:uncharacterized protein C8Q71DRAFT_765800 [Rhodofomes roseus]KAH9835421.1 hypothetical protein C8Q71DRAFT_765800 [Rhodofomes roseus]